jgi:hypothetical protein
MRAHSAPIAGRGPDALPTPGELDCAFASICETCTFFQTSIQFRPTLQAQHDDAITKHQTHRGQLFASLLARTGQDAS